MKIPHFVLSNIVRPIAGGAVAGLVATALVVVTPGAAALATRAPAPNWPAHVPGAHPGYPDPTTVPPELVPPAGQVLVASFAANGVQVYRCTAGAWVFVEPAANLFDWANRGPGPQTAIHFRGPSWESTVDGSLVEARTIATSPVSGSIPQLLLQATTTRGDGVFGHVTYVQRLNTRGGVAPAGSCAEGATTGTPYRARYRFFQAG